MVESKCFTLKFRELWSNEIKNTKSVLKRYRYNKFRFNEKCEELIRNWNDCFREYCLNNSYFNELSDEDKSHILNEGHGLRSELLEALISESISD